MSGTAEALATDTGTAVCMGCGTPMVRIGAEDGLSIVPARCDRCVKEAQRQETVRRFRSHLLESGLDEHLWSYDEVLAPDPELLRWCLANVGGWIWLGGPTGIGKTRALARALVVHSWRQMGSSAPPSALWLPAALWVEDMKGRQEEARQRQVRQVERAKRADILVFDDFGQEELNDQSRSLLFGVLDHRYVRRLRTWFTTNANGKELEVRIGESRWPQMRRRIAERGLLRTWRPGDGWQEDGVVDAPPETGHWYDNL